MHCSYFVHVVGVNSDVNISSVVQMLWAICCWGEITLSRTLPKTPCGLYQLLFYARIDCIGLLTGNHKSLKTDLPHMVPCVANASEYTMAYGIRGELTVVSWVCLLGLFVWVSRGRCELNSSVTLPCCRIEVLPTWFLSAFVQSGQSRNLKVKISTPGKSWINTVDLVILRGLIVFIQLAL